MPIYSGPIPLMRHVVNRAKAFLFGVIRGLESPADTYRVNRYAYPHRSEQEALRGDWLRVGGDMRKTIKREKDGKAAA